MIEQKEREDSEREKEVEIKVPKAKKGLGYCIFCGDLIPLQNGGYIKQMCNDCIDKLLDELMDSGFLEDYIRESALLDDICQDCPDRIPEEPMRNEGYL